MWKPIDTAPKDGSVFLAYVPDGEDVPGYWWPKRSKLCVMPCRWKIPDRQSRDGPLWASNMSGYWFGPSDDVGSEWYGVEIQPTHWMPLPEPPDEEE